MFPNNKTKQTKTNEEGLDKKESYSNYTTLRK